MNYEALISRLEYVVASKLTEALVTDDKNSWRDYDKTFPVVLALLESKLVLPNDVEAL